METQSKSAPILGLPPSSYVCRVVWFSLNPTAHILALVVKVMMSETKKNRWPWSFLPSILISPSETTKRTKVYQGNDKKCTLYMTLCRTNQFLYFLRSCVEVATRASWNLYHWPSCFISVVSLTIVCLLCIEIRCIRTCTTELLFVMYFFFYNTILAIREHCTKFPIS